MAYPLKYKKVEEVKGDGMAICNSITFHGNQMDRGQGEVTIHTVVRANPGSADESYETPENPELERITLNFNEVLGKTYTDANIPGMLVLQVLSELVEQAWEARELKDDGN